MANHKSALKRHRQSVKRNERNRAEKAEIKTLIKKLSTASKEEAPKLLKTVQSQLAKAGRKGVLHKKAASKRISKATKSVAKKK